MNNRKCDDDLYVITKTTVKKNNLADLWLLVCNVYRLTTEIDKFRHDYNSGKYKQRQHFKIGTIIIVPKVSKNISLGIVHLFSVLSLL